MKILAIRGKNLASLEGEFEIDFTAEPLKSAGIFAITGNTGAGKSTLLDALCLALFDDAPRTNKAGENIQISDVHDKTINQKDSRNILRRGASEGYAEVEFIALNGDKYRSGWSIRRAYNKADGALRSTEMKLYNLSTSTDEQGTKTDLLNKVKELIGLTFDQFTRAVLLAQGDFATFLKAKQSEKAELLEKLTGTEIYSKISSEIYKKTRDAEQALLIINERIKDIKLLTDEEIESFNQEKDTIEKDLVPLKTISSNIDKKLIWIKTEEQIKVEIVQAQNEAQQNKEAIDNAKSRYEYISMMDASQEIRDTYIKLVSEKKQLTSRQNVLFEKEKEQAVISEQVKQASQNLVSSKTTLDECEQKHNEVKPEIAKAKELDIQIQSVKERANESQKEFDLEEKQKKQSNELINKLNEDLERNEKAQTDISNWFNAFDNYKEIVSRVDLIVNLIDDMQLSKNQKTKSANSLQGNKAILITQTEKLALLEQEYERLNNLLPSEILALREKLEANKPCPVCGSKEHPLHEVNIDEKVRLEEKELELAKKHAVDSIKEIKEKSENTQKEITQLETLINNYQSQYENAAIKLESYLQLLPDWKKQLEENVLQSELLSVSKTWNENKEKLSNSSTQIETLKAKLESENKTLINSIEELNRREELLKTNISILQELISERNELLGGKKAEEVEKYFTDKKDEYSKSHEKIREQKEKLENTFASVNGNLAQIKTEIETQSKEVENLKESVLDWLNSGKHPISAEVLHDLMAKSHDWIGTEKEFLSQLRNREISIGATLKERNNRLATHMESADKPDEFENKESLAQLFSETETKKAEISKRLTEIEVEFKTHNSGKERIKTFEKELNEKNELYESWRKLNHLLGSADGNKFKTIAQGYTLDVLLGYANKHLEDITKRYRLEKIPDTLALQVVDNDMLGEVRTVHSLSGGESFLISLSLALGLSSLSSNRMKIESLFIDEGFGSLDIDTLSIAMDALENLQTQGRKIGVISHVAEMTERITTQVQVIKSSNGRSQIRVIG